MKSEKFFVDGQQTSVQRERTTKNLSRISIPFIT